MCSTDGDENTYTESELRLSKALKGQVQVMTKPLGL